MPHHSGRTTCTRTSAAVFSKMLNGASHSTDENRADEATNTGIGSLSIHRLEG